MTIFIDFLVALRATTEGPTWDPAGIRAALTNAATMGTIADVLHAAINATIDPTNRTPAIIAMHGPHWTATPSTTPRDTRPPRYEPEPVRRDPAAAAAAADCLAKVRAELETHRRPDTPNAGDPL